MPSDTRERSRPAGARWWIVQQGGSVKTVHQVERPSSTAQVGERAIRVMGPYEDNERAKRRAEQLTAGVFAERGASEGKR